MKEAEPLTKKEIAWFKKLQAVLDEYPSDRLECFTIGDSNLTFYDKNVYNEFEKNLSYRETLDVGIISNRSGAELVIIDTHFGVVSASG
jgi:hypothetical protein